MNQLKLSVRSLLKDKFYAFINVIGLSIAFMAVILLFGYVSHELAYDKHFPDHERTYRAIIKGKFNRAEFVGSQSPAPAGPTFASEIPGIVEQVRLRNTLGRIFEYQNSQFQEDEIVYAGDDFFKVFQQKAIEGNLETALSEKFKLAVSKTTAEKYFGKESALGKTLRVDNGELWQIAAVFEDFPETTHFEFDIIMSLKTREDDYNGQSWLQQNFDTYFKLAENVKEEVVQNSINELSVRYMGRQMQEFMNMSFEDFKQSGNSFNYILQPIADIHLFSENYGGFKPEGAITNIYIFLTLGVFILFLASVNFINLATARSSLKAKEVGVRKVLGSARKQLVFRFLLDTILITVLSGLIGLLLANGAQPYFSAIAGIEIAIEQIILIPSILVSSLVIGVLAGIYPALVLSSFSAIKVLKGQLSFSAKGSTLRQLLVIFQFTVSIGLMVFTLNIGNQLSFMLNKNLGFDKDQVLLVHNTDLLRGSADGFKAEVLNDPRISSASYSVFTPTNGYRSSTLFFPEGVTDQSQGVVSQSWEVDADYLRVYGMALKSGRFFSDEFVSDSNTVVVNEIAARELNIDLSTDPIIGKFNEAGGGILNYRVIGIVEDFHYESLRDQINPVIMQLSPNAATLALKVNTEEYPALVNHLKHKWDDYSNNQPFEYSFLDEAFDEMYRAERRQGKLFGIFTMLSLVIAALGLFGLTAFSSQQKIKEVGIRKVLGANMNQIIILLFKETLILISLALIIGSTLALHFTKNWLNTFAYRNEISLTSFLVVGFASFVLAILTMSYQSLRVARINPAELLKEE